MFCVQRNAEKSNLKAVSAVLPTKQNVTTTIIKISLYLEIQITCSGSISFGLEQTWSLCEVTFLFVLRAGY